MGRRIAILDVARTVALIGMAIYHFTYDMEMFGHWPPGTAMSPGMGLFARLVAGSFLFLAGVSLWLAHGRGLRWRPYLKRLAMIVAAALAVTVATWFVFPTQFVFFGILHSIAFSSVVGLLFLRAPARVTLLAAAGVAWAAWAVNLPSFDVPWLLWTGLGSAMPLSVDFVPPVPWLAPFLAGMALARIATATGFDAWLAQIDGPLWRRLGWPGRHSLAVYLIHQPVLIGLFILWARLG